MFCRMFTDMLEALADRYAPSVRMFEFGPTTKSLTPSSCNRFPLRLGLNRGEISKVTWYWPVGPEEVLPLASSGLYSLIPELLMPK